MMARTPGPISGTGATAQALAAWDASGRSRADLGRIVGRDTKVFRQVASGAKPYGDLAGAIRAATSGDRNLAAERGLAARRSTKDGGLARTRGSYATPAGTVLSGSSDAAHAAILAAVRRMAPGQRVTLTLTLTAGTPKDGPPITPANPTDVMLGGHGGMRKATATAGRRSRVDLWIDDLLAMVEAGKAGAYPIAGAGGVTTITAHVR